MRRLVPLALLCALCACQRAPDATDASAGAARPPATAKPGTPEARIERDVRTLAADDMEGREAGTRGYDKAAAYVERRMREIGLQPAGDGGTYYQQVPLLRAVRVREGASLRIVHPDRGVSLRFQDQFLPSLHYDDADAQVTAPAVFVGYGVHAPELEHDDFAGLDVKGKIAVLFPGAPARFDNDRRAFYSSNREKLRELATRGAVGAVFVNTAQDEARSPWAQGAANWNKPGMRLRGADGKGIDTFPQLRVVASVAATAADLVFDGSGFLSAELFKQAQDGALKGFALPVQIALASRTRIEPASSRNVVGKLAGSDATLAAEHVVYTAHLDHVGIGAPVDGDAIYNGALDNALGVSIMLEAARELAGSKPAPKRSLLFIALTAEEKGLLGAEWFVANPTVPRASLVADINMDMPVLLAPSTDVVPIGVEHSSLQGVLEAAAKDVGVTLSPDPFPEEVVFVRSDQYAFIRAGIPAVYLDGGVVSADGKRDPKLAFTNFLRKHYHQPSDEVELPIAYGDAARLARLNARIGRIVGDAAERPRWNQGDFFGEKFARGLSPTNEDAAAP
jgi:Zn-dependent M28 family amino/carboxypeptidase